MSAIVAALTVTAVAAVGGAISSRKAGKAQRESMAVQQRQADIQAARSRYAAVRQARIQRGAMQQQASTQGVGGSSGVLGGVAGLESSLASEVSTNYQIQGLSQQASAANQTAASAQSNAAIWGAVGGLSSSIFQGLGGFQKLGKK
jgi:hypothetical protein